jgi:two-component system chemotaxis response regulator CheV
MNSEKARLAGANAVLTKFSSPELTRCLIEAAKTIETQSA